MAIRVCNQSPGTASKDDTPAVCPHYNVFGYSLHAEAVKKQEAVFCRTESTLSMFSDKHVLAILRNIEMIIISLRFIILAVAHRLS